VGDDFDLERLKVHKIAPPAKKRVHLPVAGALPPAADVDEMTVESGTAESVAPDVLRERVVQTLKSIYDPEIPLNVYDLGLIYDLAVDEAGQVEVRMTLTAPACPVAGQIVTDVAERVGATGGVARVHVKLVWDPPWTKDRMSDEALLELGLL
jgi:FeS assembly SUF system protein